MAAHLEGANVVRFGVGLDPGLVLAVWQGVGVGVKVGLMKRVRAVVRVKNCYHKIHPTGDCGVI